MGPAPDGLAATEAPGGSAMRIPAPFRNGPRTKACAALAAILAVACATLPLERSPPPPSPPPLREARSTELARLASAATAERGGESGVHPLATGHDALLGRLVLADAAESTLDLQYYLWNDDTTGRLLLDRVVAAADRGVRVRLLLDDWGALVDRAWLRVLDAHPAIDVRLFNPGARGTFAGIANLLDFQRLERRMHAKAMVADGHFAIVGGRNVGDEYFGAAGELDFVDLDVMAVGPVVAEIARQFETYWDCAASWPIDQLVPDEPGRGSFAALRRRLALPGANDSGAAYVGLVAQGTLADDLRRGAVEWHWGIAHAMYDDPRMLEAEPSVALGRLAGQLGPVFRSARRELIVVSPYVVPGRAGVAFLETLTARGVRVRVLTNSLATTDVLAAHAAYARYREAMLDAGVELYEKRPAAEGVRADRPAQRPHLIAIARGGTMHAKVYAMDRESAFVGSFNFDPRSRRLNTELGLLLEMPELAQRVAAGFDDAVANHAWRLRRTDATLTRPAGIEWVATEDGRETRRPDEPGGDLMIRLRAMLMALMPIEDRL